MKYLSLFSGIGGFELGIKQAYEYNRDNSNNTFSGDSDTNGCVVVDDAPARLQGTSGVNKDVLVEEYENKISNSESLSEQEGVSDTQRYKTLGNAVTVNVIRDICDKLL